MKILQLNGNGWWDNRELKPTVAKFFCTNRRIFIFGCDDFLFGIFIVFEKCLLDFQSDIANVFTCFEELCHHFKWNKNCAWSMYKAGIDFVYYVAQNYYFESSWRRQHAIFNSLNWLVKMWINWMELIVHVFNHEKVEQEEKQLGRWMLCTFALFDFRSMDWELWQTTNWIHYSHGHLYILLVKSIDFFYIQNQARFSPHHLCHAINDGN